MSRPAIFLDKDGTLVEDVPYNVDPALIRLAPGAAEAVAAFDAAGYAIVVVTNQSGLARGMFDEWALKLVRARLRALLAPTPLAAFYHCPHYPEGSEARYAFACTCRKPAPGLLLRAAADLDLDLRRSWMIGDILNDVEAGHRAGCRTVLIDNGNETEWRDGPGRSPDHRVGGLAEAAAIVLEQRARAA